MQADQIQEMKEQITSLNNTVFLQTQHLRYLLAIIVDQAHNINALNQTIQELKKDMRGITPIPE